MTLDAFEEIVIVGVHHAAKTIANTSVERVIGYTTTDSAPALHGAEFLMSDGSVFHVLIQAKK